MTKKNRRLKISKMNLKCNKWKPEAKGRLTLYRDKVVARPRLRKSLIGKLQNRLCMNKRLLGWKERS
jgi:hypothetical protein